MPRRSSNNQPNYKMNVPAPNTPQHHLPREWHRVCGSRLDAHMLCMMRQYTPGPQWRWWTMCCTAPPWPSASAPLSALRRPQTCHYPPAGLAAPCTCTTRQRLNWVLAGVQCSFATEAPWDTLVWALYVSKRVKNTISRGVMPHHLLPLMPSPHAYILVTPFHVGLS